ncbi:hypothetical protein [Enterococcus sp. 5H]|uniref:hypothetical protein n=1 Tax=Enterococcus sp. 5H TaxID=1229490 RepID=UPI0023023E63|nr:hypothetical protein [Enterococcus sp. 5H]
MKKVIWIYSVNARGGSIRTSGSGMLWKRSKKFQDKVKLELLPEWDVTFISYDITENTLPSADVIMYSQMDSIYINEAIKKVGLVVPYKDILTENIENLKRALENFIEKK